MALFSVPFSYHRFLNDVSKLKGVLNQMKERKLTLVIVAIALCGAIIFGYCQSTYAAEGKTMYVNCEIGLNIRNTPGTEIEPYDTVPYQTELTVLGDAYEPGWVFVSYDDKIKCVHKHFLQEEKPADLIK